MKNKKRYIVKLNQFKLVIFFINYNNNIKKLKYHVTYLLNY